jgi:hypothetical protein
MNKFSFLKPDGTLFEMLGPPGATLDQAKAIFDEQNSTGSLVGLKPGDVLNAATQAKGGLKSALSQLPPIDDRFALDDRLAAAANGALGDDPRFETERRLAAAQAGTLLSPNGDPRFEQAARLSAALNDTPLDNNLDAANFIKQTPPNFALGPLNPADLQGMMAQTAASSGQGFDELTSAGVGKFALDPQKLESTGYLKPGTAQMLASKPLVVLPEDIAEAAIQGTGITPEEIAQKRLLETALKPSSFTGKDGIQSLDDVLDDENIQNKMQGSVLKQSYQSLSETGIVDKLTDPASLAAAVQTVATFDLSTADKLIKGAGLENNETVKKVAKAAAFAQTFAAKFGPLLASGSPLELGTKKPKGSANLVDRDTVNAALGSVVGNDKIPKPSFVSSIADQLKGFTGANTFEAFTSAGTNAFDSVKSTITGVSNNDTPAGKVNVLKGKSLTLTNDMVKLLLVDLNAGNAVKQAETATSVSDRATELAKSAQLLRDEIERTLGASLLLPELDTVIADANRVYAVAASRGVLARDLVSKLG